MRQSPQPCQSCPWLKTSDDGSYFDPEALEACASSNDDRTTVEYLRVESLHPCHSRKKPSVLGFFRSSIIAMVGFKLSKWAG